jgi:hypothetical protein
VTTAHAIPLPESDESSQEQQSSLSGGTIAVIIMAVLAVLGLGGVFLLYRSRQSRHPIPHPVVAVSNPAFLINMDDRARTGSVVVTNPADQIQYLIPMVEQAPGEYLVPVTRNEDYTYAPPLQPPADYGALDEAGSSTNEVPSGGGTGGGGGGAGKRKDGAGRDLDVNGYVVDGSAGPGNNSSSGGGHAADGVGARAIAHSSYIERSTGGGASRTAENGTSTVCGRGLDGGGVDGDDRVISNTLYGRTLHDGLEGDHYQSTA